MYDGQDELLMASFFNFSSLSITCDEANVFIKVNSVVLTAGRLGSRADQLESSLFM